MVTLPLPVLRRLPTYLLLLTEDRAAGRDYVSSTDWAGRLGATPIQVRKDLAWTGAVGTPKKGFAVTDLETKIRECLGTDARRDVFLVGTGALGRCLAGHPSLGRHGFSVVATFDPAGRCAAGADPSVLPWEKLPELARRMGISVAILAVEPSLAQKTAERLAAAGIRSLWNLTGQTLALPPAVAVLEEDWGARLATLITQTAG